MRTCIIASLRDSFLTKEAETALYNGFSGTHFVHKSERRTRDGTFIYALSADETSPALAAPRHAITALFSCRKNALALPGGNRIFAATPTERITHYTLRAKSCAKGQAPLETPDNKTG